MDGFTLISGMPLVVFLFLSYRVAKVHAIYTTAWPTSTSRFQNGDVEFYCEVYETDASMALVWFTDMDYSDTQITLTFANETSELDYVENGGQHSVQYELASTGAHRLTYRISGVQLVDEGLYACGFVPLPVPSSISPNNILGEEYATLEVLVAPNEPLPRCEFTPANLDIDLLTREGSVAVQLFCEISGGKPTPELTWYRDDYNLTTSVPQENELMYTFSTEDNGVEFTCIASGRSLSDEVSCSMIPLQILPTAIVTSPSSTVINMINTVSEGRSITFSCAGEGLPMISEIKWSVDGVSIDKVVNFEYDVTENITNASSQLSIFNAQRELNNADIACVVTIPSGLAAKASVTLVIASNTGIVLFSHLILPVVASASVFLVLILVVFLAVQICRRDPKRDDELDGIYDPSDSVTNEARVNPYQPHEVEAAEDLEQVQRSFPADGGYVINRIPGVPQSTDTMGSVHPYESLHMNAIPPR